MRRRIAGRSVGTRQKCQRTVLKRQRDGLVTEHGRLFGGNSGLQRLSQALFVRGRGLQDASVSMIAPDGERHEVEVSESAASWLTLGEMGGGERLRPGARLQ